MYLLMVAATTFVTQFVSKYLFDDWQFVISLGILIAIDTVLGFSLAFLNKKISSAGFAKLFTKIIVYAIFLIIIHTCTNLSAHGDNIGILSWIDSFGYTAIVVRESLSILEKCALINSNLIPKWILKRLHDFDDDGNLNQSAR